MSIRYSLTALDCPDALSLARFYAALTDSTLGPVDSEDPEWVEILDGAGRVLAFQRVARYVAPTWPEGSVPQQAHLDFAVDDLDAAEAHALGVGAIKDPFQPGETFRVYRDPVGHPFCLVLTGGEE